MLGVGELRVVGEVVIVIAGHLGGEVGMKGVAGLGWSEYTGK